MSDQGLSWLAFEGIRTDAEAFIGAAGPAGVFAKYVLRLATEIDRLRAQRRMTPADEAAIRADERAQCEEELAALREAAKAAEEMWRHRVGWMALQYADGGGDNGPEMRDYRQADEAFRALRKAVGE